MSNYEIKYYKPIEFAQLERDWRQLETGEDMTYFQTYDWYEMLVSLNKRKILFAEILFAEVTENNTPVMIAPFFITKNNFYKNYPKGAYFFGNQGWNDYCNLIYREFDKNAFSFLCLHVKQEYNVDCFHLDYIKETTQLYAYLKGSKLLSDEKYECVKLSLPLTKEEYISSLSKNSRQNIRTSYNRLENDGIKIDIYADDKNIDMDSFIYHRSIRVMHKNGIKHESSLLRKKLGRIKRSILNCRTLLFPEYSPFENDSNSKFLTIKNANTGELCAAFNYGLDEVHKEIVLMAVSLNAEYSRYSPGMIALYEYVCMNIDLSIINCVDFTRGDEKYKFSLGGKSHYIHSVVF